MTDFHKRSGKRRRKQDLDPFAHRRTPEENRELKRRAKQRRKQRDAEQRPRRHDWDDDASLPETPPRRVARARSRKAADAAPTARDALTPGNASPSIDAVVCEPGRTRLLARVEEREVAVQIPPAWAHSGRPWPVVGDRVRVRLRARDQLVLDELLPRTGVLARGGPGGAPRVLATHVDLGVLVLSAEPGAFRPGLVDRAGLALRRGGIDALVLLNKVDLVSAAERARCAAALADQLASGVALLAVSAVSGVGLDAFLARVRGRRLVLFGHSGVGKSTLLNALDPQGARRTGRVRVGDGKGRHTTTAGGLRRLADGTELIDTPGVRAFGLGRVQPAELDALFPQVAELAACCRFGDCSHAHEPGCAVAAALANGALAPERWARYGRLLRGED